MKKVAILGTGNIGTDILIKIQRSNKLKCTLFSGRNLLSPGIQRALTLGVNVSDKGIQAIMDNPDICDIVIDATTASDHIIHAKILKDLNKFVIDMTPAQVGNMCIPTVNLNEVINYNNINMITCGGQASIPIAYTISKFLPNIEYIEIVSSISSKSAGLGTRNNLDKYIETTERALQNFTGAKNTKTILNINPAEPCIDMQTSIFIKGVSTKIEKIIKEVKKTIEEIKLYVPGYELVLPPKQDIDKIITMIKVKGLGDYLPTYSGNLDIINCAAVSVAEFYAERN